MKPEIILKRAIEKAVKNGWEKGKDYLDYELFRAVMVSNECYTIIFSHDFAKHFWGDKLIEVVDSPTCCYEEVAWRYHQHKMLDEIQEGKDPILYLSKFI